MTASSDSEVDSGYPGRVRREPAALGVERPGRLTPAFTHDICGM